MRSLSVNSFVPFAAKPACKMQPCTTTNALSDVKIQHTTNTPKKMSKAVIITAFVFAGIAALFFNISGKAVAFFLMMDERCASWQATDG